MKKTRLMNIINVSIVAPNCLIKTGRKHRIPGMPEAWPVFGFRGVPTNRLRVVAHHLPEPTPWPRWETDEKNGGITYVYGATSMFMEVWGDRHGQKISVWTQGDLDVYKGQVTIEDGWWRLLVYSDTNSEGKRHLFVDAIDEDGVRQTIAGPAPVYPTDVYDSDDLSRVVGHVWSRWYTHLKSSDIDDLRHETAWILNEAGRGGLEVGDEEGMIVADKNAVFRAVSRALYRRSRDLGWVLVTARERKRLGVESGPRWVREEVVAQWRASRRGYRATGCGDYTHKVASTK